MIIVKSPEAPEYHADHDRRLALVRKFDKPNATPGQRAALYSLVGTLLAAGYVTVYGF